MGIKFGPAGLGAVKSAGEILEKYHRLGIKACEIAFTYGIYIKKKEDAEKIGKRARELGIGLSIHAPYYINLNSDEKAKVEASKKRILDCCEIGELLGVEIVVFHAGFYGNKDRIDAYNKIKKEIIDIMKTIREKGWKIKIAPETMGKVNVFGSIDEIAKLKDETGCSFCIDFAHILAREKKVDYEKIINLFKEEKWQCHFSGIEYGEKGERNHRKTERNEWEEMLGWLPKNKYIVIVNESSDPVGDSVEGLEIWEKLAN